MASQLGRVEGRTDDLASAADWVELFLTRTPGEASASIDGPDLRTPVAFVSRDGVIQGGGSGAGGKCLS